MTPSSPTPSSKNTPAWDVIVIGAGPAGTLAALECARQGAETLLVERQAWPRQKVCGGCLNGRAMSVLVAAGLERILEECGATTVSQLIVQALNRRAVVNLPGGLAINRLQFDAALVRAALAAGVEFLPSTKAEILPCSESMQGRQVILSSSGKHDEVIAGRIVIAADGLGHPSLNRLPEFRSQISESARIGLSVVVEKMPAMYRSGAIHMAISRSGYVGLVQTSDGRGNLAAAVDLLAVKAAASPASVVRSILEDAGLPVPQFSAADIWRGTIPLMRKTNRLSSHRVLLVGDAAAYAEPFTGEGIGWALSSALAIAPIVVRNLEHWSEKWIDTWQKSQRREMLRGQTVCKTLAFLLRQPIAVRLALCAINAVPALARPLVKRVY